MGLEINAGDQVVFVVLLSLAYFAGIAALFLRDRKRKLWAQGKYLTPRWARIIRALIPVVLAAGLMFCAPYWFFSPLLARKGAGSLPLVLHFRPDLLAVALTFTAILYRQRKQIQRMGLQSQWLSNLACAMERRLPLDQYFEAAARDNKGRFAGSLRQTAAHLRSGLDLAGALRKTQALPGSALATIEVAARYGGAKTTQVLRALSDDMREWARHGEATLLWLVYPLALWNLLIPVLLYVGMQTAARNPFGRFAPDYSNSMVSIILAGFAGGLLLLSLAGLLWLSSRYQAEEPSGKFARWALSLRAVRVQRSHVFFARAFRAIRALLDLNVPLHEAFALAADRRIAGPHADMFLSLARGAEKGESLESMLDAANFPGPTARILRAGAIGNAVPLSFEVSADWCAARARALDCRLRALLPALTLILSGIVVGSIYASFFCSWNEVIRNLRTY